MNRIMDYFRINKLTLNLNKTVCVLFQKIKQAQMRLNYNLITISYPIALRQSS